MMKLTWNKNNKKVTLVSVAIIAIGAMVLLFANGFVQAQIGFGADGNRDDQKLDFEQVRGAFEKNAFVEAVLKHIEDKSKLGEEMIQKLSQKI